ncbi:MAG: GNAT family N-acetyltransferase [Dokdonella sp.]
MIALRQANPGDADAVTDVVRQSITQLCEADHQNDPHTLATWLANKTPQRFLAWISNPDNFCVVATIDDRVSGVGLLHRKGEIRLFFLAPGAQRQGIGKEIHAALEQKAIEWSLKNLHLESTFAACKFYEALGYQSTGAATVRFGVFACYPYEKYLPQKGARERTDGARLH